MTHPDNIKNCLHVIYPYRYNGMWVFDDANVRLKREPFVGDTNRIIDRAVIAKQIPDADSGFRLVFGGTPFPRYDIHLKWVRKGDGGNYYYCDEHQMEGWLCPALFRYFDPIPQNIYALFESALVTNKRKTQ